MYFFFFFARPRVQYKLTSPRIKMIIDKKSNEVFHLPPKYSSFLKHIKEKLRNKTLCTSVLIFRGFTFPSLAIASLQKQWHNAGREASKILLKTQQVESDTAFLLDVVYMKHFKKYGAIYLQRSCLPLPLRISIHQ